MDAVALHLRSDPHMHLHSEETGVGMTCTDEETVDERTPTDPQEVKENDAPELGSDKKTDQLVDPQKQPGYMWRFSSGVFSTATGAVSMGVGGIKWAAGKSYDGASAVAGTTKAVVVGTTKAVASKVPIPAIVLKRKDKKE